MTEENVRSVEEWEKKITDQGFEGRGAPEFRGGGHITSYLLEEVRSLSSNSNNRANFFEACMGMIENGDLNKRDNWDVQYLELLLGGIEPFSPDELKKAHTLLIEDGTLLPDPSRRLFLLRFFVLQGMSVDWKTFLESSDWKELVEADMIIALDVLGWAGQYEYAYEELTHQMTKKQFDAQHLLDLIRAFKRMHMETSTITKEEDPLHNWEQISSFYEEIIRILLFKSERL